MMSLATTRGLVSSKATVSLLSRTAAARPTTATTRPRSAAASLLLARATLSRRLVHTQMVSRINKPPPSPVLNGAAAAAAAKETSTTASAKATQASNAKGWWYSAELWGALGALAGWGMSLSAVYDAMNTGPEVISLTMTPVLMVYSSLFARWAYVVQPRNMLLCTCHVTNVLAQSNQLRRALEYKMQTGQEAQVRDMAQTAAAGSVVLGGAVWAGPTLRSYLVQTAGPGSMVGKVAAADAGPFTVHFWAPMSKWLISGASFLELHRPTDKISLAQYTALTLTGAFFSRYALLVTPINYTLCSVNVALFVSSAWHLGRKINADYIGYGLDSNVEAK